MEKLPKKMVIVYEDDPVGIELATILRAFGVKVTLLVQDEKSFKISEPEIEEVLLESMTELGIEVRFGAKVHCVVNCWNGTLTVNIEGGDSINT